MSAKLNRRSFLLRGTLAGAASFAGLSFIPGISLGSILKSDPDLVVVNGEEYFDNTRKAVEMLGGMKRFVNQGQMVGLLVNSDFEDRGAYVNPDIVLSIIQQCVDAGAGEIICLQKIKDEYWQRSLHYTDLQSSMGKVISVESNVFPAKFNEEDFQIIPEIQGALLLKDIEIVKAIDSCDVFINIAIGKHHATTLYTGAIKNMMGICTRKSNVFMHLGSGTKNDPEHLGQSLAEINLYRKPDLVIVDSTYFITTNGPVGPGEIKQPQKILAGTDIVATDSMGARLLGYEASDILHIVKAHESGQGEIDLSRIIVKET